MSKICIELSKVSAFEIDSCEIKIHFPGGHAVIVNHQDGPSGSIQVSMEQFKMLEAELERTFHSREMLIFTDEG